jgi:hypothetical protein
MPIAIGPNGERFRFSTPYRGERFWVTRLGLLEKTDEFPNGKVEEVTAQDSETGFELVTREEDAELLDELCDKVKSGEIPESVLVEKLIWYFKVSSN